MICLALQVLKNCQPVSLLKTQPQYFGNNCVYIYNCICMYRHGEILQYDFCENI